MKVMMYYIVIGIAIMFLIKHSTQKLKAEMEFDGIEVPKFNWFDRLFNILFSPITLMLFINNLPALLSPFRFCNTHHDHLSISH